MHSWTKVFLTRYFYMKIMRYFIYKIASIGHPLKYINWVVLSLIYKYASKNFMFSFFSSYLCGSDIYFQLTELYASNKIFCSPFLYLLQNHMSIAPEQILLYVHEKSFVFVYNKWNVQRIYFWSNTSYLQQHSWGRWCDFMGRIKRFDHYLIRFIISLYP